MLIFACRERNGRTGQVRHPADRLPESRPSSNQTRPGLGVWWRRCGGPGGRRTCTRSGRNRIAPERVRTATVRVSVCACRRQDLHTVSPPDAPVPDGHRKISQSRLQIPLVRPGCGRRRRRCRLSKKGRSVRVAGPQKTAVRKQKKKKAGSALVFQTAPGHHDDGVVSAYVVHCPVL